jgi:hypothetical protein
MLKSIRSMLASAAIAVGVLASPNTFAQHVDIEVAVLGGKIVADPLNEAATALNGYKLFEGNFRDLAGGLYSTDDPGFADAHDLPSSGFANGNILYIRGLGALSFWNGAMWTAPASTGTTISIADAIGESLTFNNAGVSLSASGAGAIGQFDSDGGLHEHLDFTINSAAPTGAYRITGQFWAQDTFGGSPIYTDSDPFYLVFNNGLNDTAFEASVSALTTPVPEASTYALMLAGLAVVAGVKRRRTAPRR